MALLELVHRHPDWLAALELALARPPGIPERREADDPWEPPDDVDRPRRISDDLAWFRQAVEEPADHGLKPLDESAAVAAWEADSPALTRLRDRGVLDAAGFLLHMPDLESV